MSEFQKLDFSLVWYSFLALMQEKNQKKIKPPAGGGEVWLGTCLEGRMLLRPYYTGKSEIKKKERIRYPCRGVLHTPHKYPIKDYFMLHKYTSSPSLEAFGGRMLLRPYIWRLLKTKPQKQKRNFDHVGIPEIRFFSCLVFFSCLDARKEPKENQGVRDASQFWLGTY